MLEPFALASIRRQRWRGGTGLPRHRHAAGYASILLSGSYEECGSRGRFRLVAGDVIIHGRFEAHLDRFSASGAEILNVPLLPSMQKHRMGHVSDPDRILREAERDPRAAALALEAQWTSVTRPATDWPDLLAAALLRDPSCRLDRWAREHHLSQETVSRGFARMFEVSPSAFRAEARAQEAIQQIADSDLPLAEIAAQCGFADQPHMTRAVRALSGVPPGVLRSNAFKTRAE